MIRLDLKECRFDDTSAVQAANLLNNATNKSLVINNFQDYYTFETKAAKKGFLGFGRKPRHIKVTKRVGNGKILIAEVPIVNISQNIAVEPTVLIEENKVPPS